MFLVGISFGSLKAQKRTQIRGRILNEQETPLSNGTIFLLKAQDSTVLKQAISHDDGSYQLIVMDPGTYILKFSLIGFTDFYSAVIQVTDQKILHVHDIHLVPSIKQLENIEVHSTKKLIEVKPDRTILNVSSSINSIGSNAFELLKESPGVMVDNNDNISMMGKNGVAIYIDDRPSQMSGKALAAYLKGLNSSDIESIEIILSPGAKYDAAGNAGIINIKLKKNRIYGFNGNIAFNAREGVTPKGGVDLSLNYRNRKINVFSTLSGFSGRFLNENSLTRVQNDTLTVQHSSTFYKTNNLNLKAGIDYFATEKSTFGFMVTSYLDHVKLRTSSLSDIYYQPTDIFVKKLAATGNDPSKTTQADFNLNYRYKDTLGHEFNIDADYGFYHSPQYFNNYNFYSDPKGNPISSTRTIYATPVNIDIYSIKADWSRNLLSGKLDYGAKFSFVKTDNQDNYYQDEARTVLLPSKSSVFTYKENVNAAYFTFSRDLSKHYSLQFGLRAEQTNSQGKLIRSDGEVQSDGNVKRHYLDLFPNVSFNWKPTDMNSFSIAYSRRIDRPSYQDLNPFVSQLDELTYNKGNAFLRPQYTDNIALTHSWSSIVTTTVSYSKVHDYFSQVLDTLGNAIFQENKNMAVQRVFAANLTVNKSIFKWWNFFGNLWYNYETIKGSYGSTVVHVSAPGLGGNMDQTFTLPHDFTLDLSGWYRGPQQIESLGKSKKMGALNLGVQKVFMDSKASIKISLTDIFNTGNCFKLNGVNPAYSISLKNTWESRMIRVNFSYRFGSSKIKDARNRNTALDSEGQRIKEGKN